jgi:hypothetical protein
MNIKIRYRNLSKIHPEFIAYAEPPYVYLDPKLDKLPRQKKCILLEEIGHCLYPPRAQHVAYHGAKFRSLTQSSRDNLAVLVAKDEHLALQWGTSILIPDEAFWDFARIGPHELWEWIEHFDVEDWFMRTKIGFMRRKHPFKWRDIIKRY